MRAARDGDGAAYRLLLTELACQVRPVADRALARAGRGNGEVEDIVQNVLLAIHLKRDSWDPALPFMPWLNAVMRYKIVDALRRDGQRTSVPIDDLAEVLPAAEYKQADRQDAARLVGRLEPRSRTIVEAISLRGDSPAVVAQALNMTEGAVRVALHRALKTLARLYRGEAS